MEKYSVMAIDKTKKLLMDNAKHETLKKCCVPENRSV